MWPFLLGSLTCFAHRRGPLSTALSRVLPLPVPPAPRDSVRPALALRLHTPLVPGTLLLACLAESELALQWDERGVTQRGRGWLPPACGGGVGWRGAQPSEPEEASASGGRKCESLRCSRRPAESAQRMETLL